MDGEQTYLGDGLYASFDGWQIKLSTLQGDEVFLEPDVLINFQRYIASLKQIEGK